MMSPGLPALVNALAPDELRGRDNAGGPLAWGLRGVVGALTAGPPTGSGHAAVWVLAIIVGSLFATVLALRLHGVLTPAQDGRDHASYTQPLRSEVSVTAP